MTASKAVKALVAVRAAGRCERCSCDLSWPYSYHHRRPRGMGGTRRLDSPANLLLLCGSGVSGCHGEVESGRRLALDQGFLVSQYDDPALREVLYRDREWTYLGADGSLLSMPPAQEACS